jgi:hypothetical protein
MTRARKGQVGRVGLEPLPAHSLLPERLLERATGLSPREGRVFLEAAVVVGSELRLVEPGQEPLLPLLELRLETLLQVAEEPIGQRRQHRQERTQAEHVRRGSGHEPAERLARIATPEKRPAERLGSLAGLVQGTEGSTELAPFELLDVPAGGEVAPAFERVRAASCFGELLRPVLSGPELARDAPDPLEGPIGPLGQRLGQLAGALVVLERQAEHDLTHGAPSAG